MRTRAWLLCATLLPALSGQCLRDAQQNTICADTQTDPNICGYPYSMFGRPFGPTYYCHDVTITGTAPDNRTVFRTVLGGASEDAPKYLFFDAQGNIVVIGATWSANFPVTPDAAQKSYAGPAPSIGTGYPLGPGGDLFLAVLDPSGKLLHSTFAGSSGYDNLLAARDAGNAQIELLISAGAADFPASPPDTHIGPVLATWDANRRAFAHAAYLPIEADRYTAVLRNDGAVFVATPTALSTVSPSGTLQSKTTLSLREPPLITFDSSGGIWITGRTASAPVLIKFTNTLTEAFRWTLPVNSTGPTAAYASLHPPYFGPDGRVYLSGAADLLNTTPNALLAVPCTEYSSNVLAVLSPLGELQMLSYVSDSMVGFTTSDDGTVGAVIYPATVVPIDLSSRPKIGCVQDVLRRYPVSGTFGAGQVVRLRGGSFDPANSDLTVEVDGMRAPILAARTGELVFQIPWATRESEATPVNIVSGGTRSLPFGISIRQAAPQQVEPVFNPDGTPNRYDTPAPWSSIVTIYLTGAGPYSPPLSDGQIPTGPASLALPVATDSGTILYAGPAPGYLGLAQINLQLPTADATSLPFAQPHITIGNSSLPLYLIYVK